MPSPSYVAILLEGKADANQPYVFDASDDSGQILFCAVSLTTKVVSSSPVSMADRSVAEAEPSETQSAAF